MEFRRCHECGKTMIQKPCKTGFFCVACGAEVSIKDLFNIFTD